MIKYLLRKVLGIKTGLKPLPYDERDFGFSFEFLFGSVYTPKNKIKVIMHPFKPKAQLYNTCGWTASTGAKEIDEKVELDERSIIAYARKNGMIEGDGFSTLRDNEKALKDFGVCEKGLIRTNFTNFWSFSDENILTQAVISNASKHKTASFSPITTIANVYKAIDEGRPVKIGVDWRTTMNMGHGFKSPWILNFGIGALVGGHAMYVSGYNLNYYGKRCFKITNSFGNSYGDDGRCWITEDDLQKQINKYGAFTNIDIGVDVLKWLRDNQGKVVKSSTSPKVFLIQGDRKRHYKDLATLYAHGKTPFNIVIVPDETLNKVKDGESIRFWDGGNISTIKSWLVQHPEMRALFQKYINQL